MNRLNPREYGLQRPPPGLAREKADEAFWSKRKLDDDLLDELVQYELLHCVLALLRARAAGTVDFPIQSRHFVNPSDPDRRSVASAQILLSLIPLASIEVLAETLWSVTDPLFVIPAALRILEQGGAKQRALLMKQAIEYADVAVVARNSFLLEKFLPEVRRKDEIGRLLRLAIDQEEPSAIVLRPIWAVAKARRFSLPDLIRFNPDAESRLRFTEKLRALAVAVPDARDAVDALIRSSDPVARIIREKMAKWKNKDELVINLHGNPFCGKCQKELDRLYAELVSKGVEAYHKEKAVTQEPAFEKGTTVPRVLKILNETDTLGDEIKEFSSQAVMAQLDGDRVTWFTVREFDFLLSSKKNPYNSVPLSPAFLAKLAVWNSRLKSVGINPNNILPLGEVLQMLTDEKKKIPDEVAKPVVKPKTLSERLVAYTKDVGGFYYDAKDYESIKNPSDIRLLARLAESEFGGAFVGAGRDAIYDSFLKWIENPAQLNKEGAIGQIGVIFKNYFEYKPSYKLAQFLGVPEVGLTKVRDPEDVPELRAALRAAGAPFEKFDVARKDRDQIYLGLIDLVEANGGYGGVAHQVLKLAMLSLVARLAERAVKAAAERFVVRAGRG